MNLPNNAICADLCETYRKQKNSIRSENFPYSPPQGV